MPGEGELGRGSYVVGSLRAGVSAEGLRAKEEFAGATSLGITKEPVFRAVPCVVETKLKLQK